MFEPSRTNGRGLSSRENAIFELPLVVSYFYSAQFGQVPAVAGRLVD